MTESIAYLTKAGKSREIDFSDWGFAEGWMGEIFAPLLAIAFSHTLEEGDNRPFLYFAAQYVSGDGMSGPAPANIGTIYLVLPFGEDEGDGGYHMQTSFSLLVDDIMGQHECGDGKHRMDDDDRKKVMEFAAYFRSEADRLEKMVDDALPAEEGK